MNKIEGSKTVEINVVGSSSFGRYPKMSPERTYNMYVSDKWLISFAGYKVDPTFPGTPGGQGRAINKSVQGNFLILVINNDVYRYNPDSTYTLLTPTVKLKTSYGECYIDENLNKQICIVDGVDAYIYNYGTGGFAAQNITTFVPNYVCFQGGFFLFGNNASVDGSKWYAYQKGTSPTTITGVTTQVLQTKPDKALAVMRIPGQGQNVMVFGSTVAEVYTQVGGTVNYRRNSTISVDYGCASVSTIDSSEEYLAWLGINEKNSPSIMVYTGQGVEDLTKESSGIDHIMSSIKHPADSTATFSRIDGHLIYQLTFFNAEDNLTFAYDFDTKSFFNLTDQYGDYHPARQYAFFNSQTYFISLKNAQLYQLSTDFTVIDENTVTRNNPAYDFNLLFQIPRSRTTLNLQQPDTDRFRIARVVAVIEQGSDENYQASDGMYTLISMESTSPGSIICTEDGIPICMGTVPLTNFYQPRVDLSISIDGGVTFSNPTSRYLNPEGYRKNILSWERLGLCNTVAFRFDYLSNSRVVVSDASMEVY